MGKIIYLLMNISDAMKAGQSLANPNEWVNKAHVIALLTVLFNFAFEALKQFGFDLHIDPQTQEYLVKGVTGVGIGVVSILHHAANKDAG